MSATDAPATKLGHWLPLESNPQILNKFAYSMGLPKDWAFCDIYGLDPELLAFVPQPTQAVVLLFPGDKGIREFGAEQHKKIEESGQTVSEELFYLKQINTIGNACGTIACIHALANCSFELDDSPLNDFVKKSKESKRTPEEIGNDLLSAPGIRQSSEASAESKEAQTATPAATDKLDAHFIAFVFKSGDLYEMDGRKAFPINHGSTTHESFLQDVAKVVKESFMSKTDSVKFNLCALAKAQD